MIVGCSASKILMIRFIDLKILVYLNIAMRIMNSIPILMILLRESPLSKKRLIFLQESMEEEINETVSSLDEKDEEDSEEQKEEEWIDHPCPPSNESNSSTHTLFNFPSCLPKDDCYDDCYDPVDSLEISLFDDACYACGQDANMNYSYGDELAIVLYVKN